MYLFSLLICSVKKGTRKKNTYAYLVSLFYLVFKYIFCLMQIIHFSYDDKRNDFAITFRLTDEPHKQAHLFLYACMYVRIPAKFK